VAERSGDTALGERSDVELHQCRSGNTQVPKSAVSATARPAHSRTLCAARPSQEFTKRLLLQQQRAVKLRGTDWGCAEGETDLPVDGRIGAEISPVQQIGGNLQGVNMTRSAGELRDPLAIAGF